MTLHTIALVLVAALAFTLLWEQTVTTSGAVSLIAVPAISLSGSVLAVAAAAAVQIGGNLHILRREA